MLTSSYPRFPGDGTATFVKSLAESMTDLGHQVWVLAPYDPAVQTMEMGDVHVYRFRYVWPDSLCLVGHARSLYGDVRLKKLVYLLTPLFIVSAFFHLLALTLRHQFDVIQAHWVLPGGLIAVLVAKLRDIPLVVSLHGSDIYVAEQNQIFGWLARLTFRWAQRVTACSQDLYERALALGLSPDKAQVIPYGVDLERFASRSSSREEVSELRDRLGLRTSDIVVGGMGRLVHKKGFEYLIRAVPQLIQSFPNVKVIIAGDGDLRPELSQLAEKLGMEESVIFPGHISWESIPAYLSLCDLLVVPSVQDHQGNVDGLPNVLLEAMAAGRPIVASHVAGIPAVIHHGESGILVPQKEPEALAAAITEVLKNPQIGQQLGANAQVYTRQHLSWAAIAARFIEQLHLAQVPRSVP